MTRERRTASGATARGVVVAALGLVLAGGLQGCGEGPTGPTLRVHAAASLAHSFQQLAQTFEREHDGVEVVLTFAGSSDLATQLEHGAEADVFASADTVTMDRVADAGLVADDPVVFAANSLQIAVPPGNPAEVTGLEDLAKDGLRVVVCAPQVPCGAAATQVEQEAQVELAPVSEEQSVTDVLGKVSTGEADAGLVYVTDVLAAQDRVEGVALPDDVDVTTSCPIAALEGSDEPELAGAFLDLVLGPEGQAVLEEAGFRPPGAA